MILHPGIDPAAHAMNLRALGLDAYATELEEASQLTGSYRTRALRLAIEHASIACDGMAIGYARCGGGIRYVMEHIDTERDALHTWLSRLSTRYHDEREDLEAASSTETFGPGAHDRAPEAR